ncbi:hypothetical protein TWF481_005970 [Arthrobotrys musiformis]|uniref:Ig-like domain-containing protein n=1 Tax=Arthrobotrys musiformis TaxID=47236 RepID=A0AAV9WGQ8_9PEZI
MLYENDFRWAAFSILSSLQDSTHSTPCEWLPPLPRNSTSEPIVVAKARYRKLGPIPRGGKPEYPVWEIQAVIGGCSPEEIKRDNLKLLPPGHYPLPSLLPPPGSPLPTSTELEPSGKSTTVQSTGAKSAEATTTSTSEGPTTSAATATSVASAPTLAKRLDPIESEIPLEGRGWSMRCYVEPYSQPFNQTSNLENISAIKDKIAAGSIKPAFGYHPRSGGNCQQHYCDPSSNIKVSLCGDASSHYTGNLYLPELIENGLAGLSDPFRSCFEERNITSDPRFYRISHLLWVGPKPRHEIIRPDVSIGQLEAGMPCEAFISGLQPQTPPFPPPSITLSSSSESSVSVTGSVSSIPSLGARDVIVTTYTSVPANEHKLLITRGTQAIASADVSLPTPSPPMTTTAATSANRASKGTTSEPNFKEVPYYLGDFEKTGKGGNSVWLFNETSKTGGLDPDSIIKLQQGLYNNFTDKNFETFQNFPDFIVELPEDQETFEMHCTHYYCDDSSKGLISMCGNWWNGLPAPYADTLPTSYNVNATRLIAKSRWVSYFCNAVEIDNPEWINSCDPHDYNELEQSNTPFEQRRPYPFTRGLVREFSPEGGMAGPSAFKVEHLSLYGANSCHEWNKTWFPSETYWLPERKILYDSGRRYEDVGTSNSTYIPTNTGPSRNTITTASIEPSDASSSISSTVASPLHTPTDTPGSLSQSADVETPTSNPVFNPSTWKLESPPTPVGPDRPDPTDKPQSEDPDKPWIN